nr:hypothetical protein [Mycolicibacterium baixiangningiae]
MYASSKKENNYFGFGTDNDVEHSSGYPVIKHRTFGRNGAARNRPGAFRPASVVNISAMSFGSLSGNAVEALNRGAGARPGDRRRPRHPNSPTPTACSTG